MTARNILAGLSGLCLAAAAGLLLVKPEVPIKIPQDRLMTELAARLPVTRAAGPARITVTAVDLSFMQDALSIDAHARVTSLGVAGEADISAHTGLRYEGGKVYLEDPRIVDADVDIDGAQDMDASSRAAQERFITSALPAVTAGLQERLEDTPIHDFSAMGWRGRAIMLSLRDVSFAPGALELSMALANPVTLALLCLLALLFGGLAHLRRARTS